MRRFNSVLYASIGVLLTACALPPVPEDAFYRLDVSPPRVAYTTYLLPGILEIDPFRADPLTSGRAMLYHTTETPTRVYRLPYTFWMEAPAAMLQREAAEYLRAAHVAKQVVTPSVRASAEYALTGTILRLEQIRSESPAVVMELELSVVERGSRALLFHQTYFEEVPANGQDVTRTAATAFSRAYSSILERFVADLDSSLNSR